MWRLLSIVFYFLLPVDVCSWLTATKYISLYLPLRWYVVNRFSQSMFS